MRISELSNEQLLASLRTVVGDERRLVAQVLALLAEVEERRIDLELSYSSLYDFCTRRLGFSEDQACRRIAVARLGRRFPQLLDAIAAGRMHLSGVHQLRALFTEANVDELIASASGKSRAELDRLIAKLAPKPDVPESIQRLPEQASLGEPLGKTSPSPGARPRPVGLQLMPLSEERFCVTVTIGRELNDKIEKVRALMRHPNPTGDLSVILERALDLLLVQLEKEVLGKAKHPRKSKGTKDPADVTRETRREVFERDAEQCTFVSVEGERCRARELLELDHRQARALGGAGTTANIRVLCRAHNQLEAEKTFGREFVEKKRRRTSDVRKSAAPSAPMRTTTSSISTNAGLASAVVESATLETRAIPPTASAPSVANASAASASTVDNQPLDEHVIVDVARTSGASATVRACAERVRDAKDRKVHRANASPVCAAEAADPRQRGWSSDPRSPREKARFALVGLGFRAAATDRALDALPPTTWSGSLEDVIRAALTLLA